MRTQLNGIELLLSEERPKRKIYRSSRPPFMKLVRTYYVPSFTSAFSKSLRLAVLSRIRQTLTSYFTKRLELCPELLSSRGVVSVFEPALRMPMVFQFEAAAFRSNTLLMSAGLFYRAFPQLSTLWVPRIQEKPDKTT